MTFGVIADRRHIGVDSTSDLGEFAAMANRHPGACAFGKIVVLAKDGIFTFQADASGGTVPAFCGNSTAAAVSYLGGNGEIRANVHGPATDPYEVSAHVRGDRVSQSWIVPGRKVEERVWRGRRVMFLPTLNDYAIVLGALPAGVAPESARRELLGSRIGKLAVVGGTALMPVVEFYNANGRHGAFPQTGVATIALAARSTAWLQCYFPDGYLTYQSDSSPVKARLPAIADTPCGRIAITMPSIEVSLTPLAMEMVA